MAATNPSGRRVLKQGKSDASQDRSSWGTSGLHFVVSTNVEKPDPELRKVIRSHVMMGKNRGKTFPRRKKKTKDVHDPSFSSSNTPLASTSSTDEDLVGPPASSATASHPVCQFAVPRKFGTDWSTFRFPDGVEPGTVDVVLQFSAISKQIMYPLETCILFERRAEHWITPLTIDPAYLHAMIFTSQFYFDSIVPRKFSSITQRTLPHYLKTLKLLRERFAQADDEARLSNTTVWAVMGLAGHAHMTGDFKSARNHMEGLCKIVSLRGGVASFKDIPKLLVEILKCDISMALHGGSRPVFFNNPSSREPFQPYPDLTLLLNLTRHVAKYPSYNSATFTGIDHELARAWKVMSDFCSVINFAADSGQRISTETLLDTMASVLYRLLDMRFEAGSSDEAIRLGLLTFSCSVFLQWRYLGMSYPYFTFMVRDCLARLQSSQISSQLLLWLLMVGAVSVFDASDDEWLTPLLLVNIGLCEIDSWSKMQDLMKSFMWIGLVYDKPGKGVFDSTVARSGLI